MLLLPQILYIFQTLVLQTTMMLEALLIKHRLAGGMGLIDITLKPISSLRRQFNLMPIDLYRYYQVTYLLGSIKTDVGWPFYTNSPTPPKGISFFNNLFQHILTFTKYPPYQKWEANLGKSFTTFKWQCTLKTIYKPSKCVNHWEQSKKLALMWYLTPYRVSKFCQTNSPLCWRDCGGVGNILHTFWSCKLLTSFWHGIFRCISNIMGILTPPNLSISVLNIGLENFPSDFRTVVTHVLLVARSLIKNLIGHLCFQSLTIFMNLYWLANVVLLKS